MAGNGEVLLTVTANRGVAGSRTSFEHDGNGGLLTNWDDNDQLVVTDEAGNHLGVLSITSGAGTSSATFEGTVNLGELEAVNIHYLGNALTEGLNEIKNEVTFDMSAQNGSFASLTDYDYLYSQTVVTNLNNGTATATIDMARAFATGYFSLDCADFSLEAGDVVTISPAEGTTLYSKPVMKLRNFSWNRNEAAEGTVTITKAEAGNDFYVIFPAAQTITPVFTVTKGTTVYTASLGSHTWNAQTHVNADGTSNTPVKVTGWTSEKMPTNPGDFNNWPDPTGPGKAESWTVLTNKEFSKTGRYTNCLDLRGVGGWATYNEIKNGIKTNLLTTYGGSAFFFQWGRPMGFPSNIANAPNMPNSASTPYAYGNPNNEAGSYVFHYEIDYTNWGYTDSNKYPYVFSLSQGSSKTLDWYAANPAQTTWEQCCGNPCPDGYRIPTVAELEVFVPEGNIIKGSTVQYKTINGIRYAIEWVVTATSGSTPSFVTIRSAQTNRTDVEVNDAIFENSNAVKLTTYGYIQLYPYSLRNTASYINKGSRAIYWSNESGDAGEMMDSSLGISGNGGKCLYLETSGTTAYLGIKGYPRTFGGCVMPIKDDEAKGISIKPWYPYASTWF